MLRDSWVPTPLFHDHERSPLDIVEHPLGSRFRMLYVTRELTRLALAILWCRLRGKLDGKTLGRLMRLAFQRMGALWIKLGQLLALRRDLFPAAACDELEKLQERADGFPPELALACIERELHGPIDQFFSLFERNPFAAASIAQVHKAKLRKEDCWVAVKVRRPNVQETFHRDMQVIRTLVAVMRRLGVMQHMRWKGFIWEIEQLMTEELDYRYEADNMRRMRKTLRRHGIYVPKLFSRYCTRNVLVMEHIDGLLMVDYLKMLRNNPDRLQQWCDENDVKPKRVARRLLLSHQRQAVEDNLFHSDLHPGNIFLFRKSRIGFIDFGSVGTSGREFLDKYVGYQAALMRRQYAKAVDLMLKWGDSVPACDLSELRSEMVQLFRGWEARTHVRKLSYDEKSIAALGDRLTALLGRFKVPSAWSFLKIARARATMDAAVRELTPNANPNNLQKIYFRKKIRRDRKRKTSATGLSGDIGNLVDLPSAIYDSVVDRGAVIRRMAQNFEGSTSKAAQLAGKVCGIQAGLVALLVAWLLLVLAMQHHPATLDRWLPVALAGSFHRFPRLDYQVWVLLFAAAGYVFLALRKLKRNFDREEPRIRP